MKKMKMELGFHTKKSESEKPPVNGYYLIVRNKIISKGMMSVQSAELYPAGQKKITHFKQISSEASKFKFKVSPEANWEYGSLIGRNIEKLDTAIVCEFSGYSDDDSTELYEYDIVSFTDFDDVKRKGIIVVKDEYIKIQVASNTIESEFKYHNIPSKNILKIGTLYDVPQSNF